MPREEQPHQVKGRFEQLKEAFAKDLEYVGLFVFAVTAVAMILFVIAFNFIPPSESKVSYRHLRSAELLLTLAATGLVVAIVGRATNAFVLAFGIFLIGALIVPSKDIVRFALIASGSDRDYGSLFQSARSGTDLAGRSTDVANKIITELGQNGFMDTPNPVDRKNAIRIVQEEVRKEREITLLDQVSARGALDTISAAATDIESWVYKYGREEKFIDDIRYLRSEGLVSFAYEDLDTIAITPLGRAVLGWTAAGPVGTLVSASSLGADPVDFMDVVFDESVCPPDFDRIQDLSRELRSTGGYSVKLESDFTFMRFEVPKAANYRIDVQVKDPSSVAEIDPVLGLFYMTEENVCFLLASNDDGGDNLNSRLSLLLEPRTYVIATRTISLIEGDVTVSVKESAE
jgi:hypothetical protein